MDFGKRRLGNSAEMSGVAWAGQKGVIMSDERGTERMEAARRAPEGSEERIRRLLEANNEELERRRRAENHLENELVVRDALISRVRQLEKRGDRKFVFGFMAGFGAAYLILEGLRWLLS